MAAPTAVMYGDEALRRPADITSDDALSSSRHQRNINGTAPIGPDSFWDSHLDSPLASHQARKAGMPLGSAPGAFPTLHALTNLAYQAEPGPRKKGGRAKAVRDEDGDADAAYNNTMHNNSASSVYDVKFYPYLAPEDEAIFAVVFARSVYVFRPLPDPKHPHDILAVFRDPQPDASLNSLVWSQDLETLDPLLCVGGAGSGDIKVFNVVKEKFDRNLSGHGGAINDLAISPLSPTILASASADFSIRLWNLEAKYRKQPCAAILASPDAHKQPVLALAFHSSGKYLLSGGTDTMINLWPVPEVPDINAGTDKTTCVYFPHFSSTEIHSDYVDCLHWHGDLILSHAASTAPEDSKPRKNAILLWKIDGFSSAAPVPDNPPMAKPGVFTRSSFGGRFQRLLTFDMPNSSPFYMRFSLFAAAGHHPILVMGNERSKLSFWDLQALWAGHADGRSTATAARPKKHLLAAAAAAQPRRTATPGDEPASDESDDDSDDDAAAAGGAGADEDTPAETPVGPARAAATGQSMRKKNQEKLNKARFDIRDPFRPIAPHYTLTVPKYNFTFRQVAWSNCGSWCVAVGDIGIVCVFRRWIDAGGVVRRE